jgi:hypothetical protein
MGNLMKIILRQQCDISCAYMLADDLQTFLPTAALVKQNKHRSY